ncbi:hypothetical protein [Pedobacter sp. MW01-1-1]|uniref:hypothetical protein n=1 Tax=Pedobacter sp. MW01-1-1 TaxID=3383027 RepID=UPI003FF085AC
MKKIVYHYTRYVNDPFGHGGCKRSNQIIELIKKSDAELHTLCLDISIKNKGTLSILLNLIVGIWYFFILRIPFLPSIKGLAKIGLYTRLVNDSLAKINTQATIVIEDFEKLGAILALQAKRKGIKVIGIVHNLDSLVPEFMSSFSSKKSPEFFEEELFFIRHCSIIYTISREENWLLNLNNIQANYLPYCPSETVFNQLSAISKRRMQYNGRGFILGTVLNPPTFNGMVDLITELEKSKVYADVAGFGTEKLLERFPSLDYIKIHGAISFDQMSDFLENNSFFLVNQPYTAGVLTRIVECLIAGIPVLGNESSLRSYYYMNGVYLFDLHNIKIPKISNSTIDISEYFSVLRDKEKLFLESL